ncbi:oxidoreductase [bacterium]|nr:oxidoreductase [bacterium]
MFLIYCSGDKAKIIFTGAQGEVKLLTLDPGHFHAALVQKKMYDQVSAEVYVYAPEGPDVEDHLNQINGFNTRVEEYPTTWEEIVYRGPDYLERMVEEKKGNVVVVSGNNREKTEYIKASVNGGLNVLADKPMCIDANGFELLKQAFASAEQKGVLLYDIMTERHEITTLLQKNLAQMEELFGEFVSGTPENPSVVKESVHHFFKYVSGSPIKRPAWYFDVRQQGEGIVDVTTHLVDLVQWGCFPEQILDYTSDIQMIRARHWPTLISREQFERVTHLSEFPDYLKKYVNGEGVLSVLANGEMVYRIKGIIARVAVEWNYEAPEGGGDTHFSMMRGTKANLIIRQDKEQNYRPELYVEAPEGVRSADMETAVHHAVEIITAQFPGVALNREGESWHVVIPDMYRVGHEAHFAQVMETYLQYLVDGRLPEWEVPNMLAKYYTTTSAYEMAQ